MKFWDFATNILIGRYINVYLVAFSLNNAATNYDIKVSHFQIENRFFFLIEEQKKIKTGFIKVTNLEEYEL